MRRMALMSHHEHEDLLSIDLDVHYLLENPDRETVVDRFYLHAKLDAIKTICPHSQTFSQSCHSHEINPAMDRIWIWKSQTDEYFAPRWTNAAHLPKVLQFGLQLCVNCALKFLSTSLCIQTAMDVAFIVLFICTAHSHWPHTGCEVV